MPNQMDADEKVLTLRIKMEQLSTNQKENQTRVIEQHVI
jgi:hypothetical protein